MNTIVIVFSRLHRMTLSATLFLFICMLPFCATAQKNRPVMKDVNNLLGILGRDYYATEDIELRLTAIQNDRANVIAILKSYATSSFDASAVVTNQDSIDKKTNEIKLLKLEIAGTGGLKKEVVKDVRSVFDEIAKLNNGLNKKFRERDSLMFARDTAVLSVLSYHFSLGCNVFLHDMTLKFVQKFQVVFNSTNDSFTAGNSQIQTQKSLNLFSGGALTLTNAIDGLAMFMAKRIKEELAAQVFDKIKEMLSENYSGKEKFSELKILLPRTTQILKTVAPEQYQGILNTLKESIKRDLDDLLLNITKLDQSPRIAQLLQQHPELDLAFLGMQLINDLNKAKNPTDIVFLLENSSLITRWSTQGIHQDFVNGIKLTALLTYAITEDVADRRKFIPVEEWDGLYQNSNFYQLFTGFIFQQNKKFYNIRFGNRYLNDSLVANRSNINGWYEVLSPRIKDMLRQATEIEAQVDALKSIASSGKKLPVDSVAQLLRSSVTFLDSAISTSNQLMKKLNYKSDLKSKTSLYFLIARNTIDIYVDLHSKQYYGAIAQATEIFLLLEKQTHLAKRSHYLNLMSDLNNYTTAFQRLYLENQNRSRTYTIKEFQDVLNDLRIYVPLPSSANTLLSNDPSTTIASVDSLVQVVIRDLRSGEVTFLRNWLNAKLAEGLRNEGMGSWTIPPPPNTTTTRGDFFLYLSSLATAIQPQITNDPDIVKVINFITALAKAESAEEFSKAIEAIVLPAGSALIKREAAFNISLNGYAGFFGGIEQLRKTNDRAANAAFTVPIGVAFSKSFRKPCSQDVSCKKSGSWSIFVSAIDIGTFTSIRFKDSDQTLPEIKFKNILAPGIQLIYGIPKTSFSIAAGFQYGPFLRKISDDTNITTTVEATTTNKPSGDPATSIVSTSTNTQVVNQTKEMTAFHFGISFLIDIPLLNFYTKSKGMK